MNKLERLSKYVVKTRINKSQTALYNMLTKQHMLIDNENRDSMYPELEHQFYMNKTCKSDKEELLNPVRNSYLFSDKVARYVVHLNYDCNLKCSYCYQNVISEKEVMTEVTVNEVVNFINVSVNDIQPEQVDICFIGGEPMLHSKSIENIMKTLSVPRERTHFNMVTNGTIMGRKYQRLYDLGLKELMITLDGPRLIHDNFRVSKHGSGSFDKILENIALLNEKYPDINIQINCNLNAENVDSIPELIQQLKVQNITYPLIFSDVIDTKDEQYEYTLKEDTHWYEVHKIALEEGYTYEPFYRDIFLGCSMFQKNNFIIGANGYLYSCIEAVGLKQFQQVHVREYGEFMFDFIRSQEINKNESLEDCIECKFLPVCDGDCYYKRFSKTFKCPKNSFESNSIPLVHEFSERMYLNGRSD